MTDLSPAGAAPSATAQHRLTGARRLVVKIGSSLLIDAKGAVRRDWLQALAQDLARCHKRGQDIILVSSGAIALGRRPWAERRHLSLEESQAAAAMGQIRLAHAYQEALGAHDMAVAQILLTSADTELRRRYLNARNTFETLLDRRVVPVVNENDTVATEEIRFGDNDRLAARVAAMVSADCLLLLSDIDGLYSADPRQNPEARLIPEVFAITDAIEAMAGIAASPLSRGGMVTKIQAARIAVAAGCHLAISNGKDNFPLSRLESGGKASWFVADASPVQARKRWIAGSLRPAGVVTIDSGAHNALRNGKSLLPAGVTGIEGRFQRGDAVVIRTAEGAEIGRGLSAYSAPDAQRIKGRQSHEIAGLLGYAGRQTMIHRDDLVLL